MFKTDREVLLWVYGIVCSHEDLCTDVVVDINDRIKAYLTRDEPVRGETC